METFPAFAVGPLAGIAAVAEANGPHCLDTLGEVLRQRGTEHGSRRGEPLAALRAYGPVRLAR
jgi:hypothetical protein